jgi:hypothetical protein
MAEKYRETEKEHQMEKFTMSHTCGSASRSISSGYLVHIVLARWKGDTAFINCK